MAEYQEHYDLEAALAGESRLIPAQELYNFDTARMMAAAMDRLAQPLTSGAPSPFSNQSPGTGHSILIGTQVHLQDLLAHELNLMTLAAWVRIYRMLGVELRTARYPVINLVFQRHPAAVTSGLMTFVPQGTVVSSNLNADLWAITTGDVRVTDNTSLQINVPARLNKPGALPNIRNHEFTKLGKSISGIDKVFNDGSIIDQGAAEESLVDAMMRAREGIRTGSLGRTLIEGEINPTNPTFNGRCVTPRDFYFWAMQMGAGKVNVLKRDTFSHGLAASSAVVIYPEDSVAAIKPKLLEMTLDEAQVNVMGAELIPLTGTITVRVNTNITDGQARNLVAIAVSQQVNPPYGVWGDTNFDGTLSTALENTDGIYAVPLVDLHHEETELPLAEIVPTERQLFEIQNSVVIKAVR